MTHAYAKNKVATIDRSQLIMAFVTSSPALWTSDPKLSRFDRTRVDDYVETMFFGVSDFDCERVECQDKWTK